MPTDDSSDQPDENPAAGAEDRLRGPTSEEVAAHVRAAASLEELLKLFRVDSIDEAYFRAKEAWNAAMMRRQKRREKPDRGLPGTRVRIGGDAVHVHGVTHAGTAAEESFLRKHVEDYLAQGAAVYCEQGIRRLYFGDFASVCEMDDYRWAMSECAALEGKSRVEGLHEDGIDGLVRDLADAGSAFREATYSLIESGSSVYGDRFEHALGDVAATFVTDHADVATGKSYEAFSLSRTASRDPDRLIDLQRYYERTFLPQPLEREWLRKHDPELELLSHARNERMADYVMYHHDDPTDVHLIVGAAHQTGVEYYLERYREGRELPDPFELF